MREKAYLFLDTSVYIGTGYNFVTGKLLAVLKYCNSGIIQLLIDDVVINEVDNHIRNDLDTAFSQVNNKLRGCHLNGLRQTGHLDLINSEKMINLTIESWKQYRKSSEAILLDSSNISIDDILADYFESNPPFEGKKEKKHEFPDAIVINKIKHFAEQNPDIDNIYVVSQDKGWEKAFVNFPLIKFFNDIEPVLEKLSSSKNGRMLAQIEEILPSFHEEMEAFIKEKLISEQHLIIDLDFEEIEEAYFRSLCINKITLDYVNEKSAICSIHYTADIVLDYDSFYFSTTNGYCYSHDLHRDLHRVKIELNVCFEHDNEWSIRDKSIIDIPEVSKDTLIKDLPHYCAECEERLFSENETDSDMCRSCIALS